MTTDTELRALAEWLRKHARLETQLGCHNSAAQYDAAADALASLAKEKAELERRTDGIGKLRLQVTYLTKSLADPSTDVVLAGARSLAETERLHNFERAKQCWSAMAGMIHASRQSGG